jgi:hypothetical protein
MATGRAICGCVCWGAALLVSVYGTPGPDAQGGSDFLYSHVVRQLVAHPQVCVWGAHTWKGCGVHMPDHPPRLRLVPSPSSFVQPCHPRHHRRHRRHLCSTQGAAIIRLLLDACSTMLLTLHQLLQAPSLPQAVQEELSIHSGGALHHIGQLFSHALMYHATMIVSPGGRHIMRLLMSASCLAGLLPRALRALRVCCALGLFAGHHEVAQCRMLAQPPVLAQPTLPCPAAATRFPPHPRADNAASKEAIVPLLMARCNLLLVQLSEFRDPPIVDALCEAPDGTARLHHYVAVAARLAQRCLAPRHFPEEGVEERPNHTTGAHDRGLFASMPVSVVCACVPGWERG